MSKLTNILASAVNGFPQPNTFTAINSDKVYDIVPSLTNPNSCTLLYKRLDGTTKESFEAASAPSAVRALLDYDPGSDVKVLPVTINNQDGTASIRSIQINSIHHILVDPLNSARANVFIEDQVKTQINALNVNSTLDALVTSANAAQTPPGGSQWNDVTSGINYADGNVGIGNAAPTVPLDVVGINSDKTASFQNPNNYGFYFGNIDSVDKYGIYDYYSDFPILSYNHTTQETIVGLGGFSQIVFSNIKTNVIFRGQLNVADIKQFANNAAAISGGLVAGDMYYTNVAGDGILKIVI